MGQKFDLFEVVIRKVINVRTVGYFYVLCLELSRTVTCLVYVLERCGAMQGFSIDNND